MTAKDDNHRQIETDNSLREVSRNDAIALIKEKSLRRRKSRLYTFTEIMDQKNDTENLSQTQVVVPLPPLPPPSLALTFPKIVPPKFQPSNTQTKGLDECHRTRRRGGRSFPTNYTIQTEAGRIEI
ncbi:hypothetical protein P8452_25546 [Trifolium repens]|nr:hypothetical protein P8452_25546 [Trifolium repens]